MFADYNGSYKEYCKNSGHKLPLIVTVLNAYEVIKMATINGAKVSFFLNNPNMIL